MVCAEVICSLWVMATHLFICDLNNQSWWEVGTQMVRHCASERGTILLHLLGLQLRCNKAVPNNVRCRSLLLLLWHHKGFLSWKILMFLWFRFKSNRLCHYTGWIWVNLATFWHWDYWWDEITLLLCSDDFIGLFKTKHIFENMVTWSHVLSNMMRNMFLIYDCL